MDRKIIAEDGTVKGNPSILIVEDGIQYLKLIEEEFKEWGYTKVDTAITYEDAYRKLSTKNYDIVIMDYGLQKREFGGDRLLCELPEVALKSRVYANSAEFDQELLDLGAVEGLGKSLAELERVFSKGGVK